MPSAMLEVKVSCSWGPWSWRLHALPLLEVLWVLWPKGFRAPSLVIFCRQARPRQWRGEDARFKARLRLTWRPDRYRPGENDVIAVFGPEDAT